MSEPGSDSNEELARAQTAAQDAGCDAALLSSLANVTYVSGFEVPVPVGAGAELSFGPSLALFTARDAGSWLIVPAGSGTQAKEQSRLGETLTVAGFDSFSPTDQRAAFLGAIRDALTRAGLSGSSGRLGIESRSLPQVVSALLVEVLPGWTLVDVEPALQRARLIKTAREIGLLRRAAGIGDVAHHTLAEFVQAAGRTEFEMWAEITARVYRAVGREVPLTGELVTGPRTTTVNYPNGPRRRTTEPGDAALMDLSGRVDGYWFDCTNSHVIGTEPSAEQRRYAKASQAACEAAMDALRPGNRACDAAATAEAAFGSFGLPMAHYAGHQIGVTVNELPRLVPYDRTPIAAGMVFSVEPGAYEGPGGSFGARSEKMVLVTESGPEILSTFAWGIA